MRFDGKGPSNAAVTLVLHMNCNWRLWQKWNHSWNDHSWQLSPLYQSYNERPVIKKFTWKCEVPIKYKLWKKILLFYTFSTVISITNVFWIIFLYVIYICFQDSVARQKSPLKDSIAAISPDLDNMQALVHIHHPEPLLLSHQKPPHFDGQLKKVVHWVWCFT